MATQQRSTTVIVRRKRRPLLARMLASLELSRRRFWQNALLLASLGLGMLVATALFCAVPVFANTVAEIGLQQALAGSDVVTRNLELDFQSGVVDAGAIQHADNEQASLARQYLGSFIGASHRVLSSDALLLQSAGKQQFDITAAQAVEARYLAYNYQTAASHIRLEHGSLPDQSGAPAALVTDEMAEAFHLQVGDMLVLTPFGDHSRQLPLQIAGIWAPNDPADAYWYGWTFGSDQGPNQPPLFPLLASNDTFLTQLAGIPNLGMEARWQYYIQPEQIHIATLGTTQDALGSFSSEATNHLLAISGASHAEVQSGLMQLLGAYQQKLNLLSLPLYVVMAQVLGLILFYIAVVAGLLVERQAGEIATLKSRGASGTQVLGVYLAQGAALAVLAAALGPLLAVFLTRGLVSWLLPGTANLVSAGYLGAVTFPASTFLFSALAALLGLLALGLAVLRAARLDVLAFRRESARTLSQPFWQRFYLDIVLAVLCAAGYLELGQFGTAGVRSLLGGSAAADPLLLLAPGLLLLAGALLALRFFPLVVRWSARLAARGRGATALLALVQMARSPLHYGRLVLLLTLAVGLGLFALTFSASLSQSQADRAGYAAGADLRVVESPLNATPAAFDQHKQLAALAGVQATSPARRTTADTEGATPASIDVLAVDPASFGAVASWRADFAGQSLDALMTLLKQHALSPTQVNQTPTPALWALVSQSFLSENELAIGDTFTLAPSESAFAHAQFRVGAVVQDFPTMYDRGGRGYIIVDLNDYLELINNASGSALFGPTEFWLHTTDDANMLAALRHRLAQPDLDFEHIWDRRSLLATAQSDPLQAGVRGVLLLGVVASASLAVLGCLLYSGLTARQRATQFAVLRTLGASAGQLVRLLLSEQLAMYVFGLLAGTVLGALLSTATLPYLEFGAEQSDPAVQATPPLVLALSWPAMGLFYASLALAFLLALLWMARYAARLGLGSTLRLGEE